MTYFVRSILIFLTLGAAAAAHAQAVLLHNPRLSVMADGVYKQVPDIAKLSIGVSNRADDAKTALAENSTRMNQVIALIDPLARQTLSFKEGKDSAAAHAAYTTF